MIKYSELKRLFIIHYAANNLSTNKQLSSALLELIFTILQ